MFEKRLLCQIMFRYLVLCIKQSYDNSYKNVMKLEQIKNKIRYGDYITLSEMLITTPDTAKMRVRRGDKDALAAH